MNILNLIVIVKQNTHDIYFQMPMVQLATLVNKIDARRCRNNLKQLSKNRWFVSVKLKMR